MEPNRHEILAALENVIDPELRRPVTELDMVRGVRVDGRRVAVTIALTVAGCPLRSSFQEQVAREVGAVHGVEEVELAFDVMTPDERQALVGRLRGGVTERTRGVSVDASTRVIAVTSGKGGVGKSSLTVNIAAALAADGRSVGILDADVYGHSIPHLLDIRQKPVLVDRMIVPPVKTLRPQRARSADRPVVSDGQTGKPARPEDDTSAVAVKLMSIGFFLDENGALMWRGPMLGKALEQFLGDVHWGDLDYLLVDMPPGTGDIAISLGQLLPRAEVLVVTTPQPLAQEVAVRAALIAQRTNMRLLGVIENMSGDVFGRGGGEALAAQLDVPLLGIVPLDPRLRAASDLGTPLVVADPDAEASRAIAAVAEALAGTERERGVGIVKSLPLVS